MKIKTSELTGDALDWAVAKAKQPEYSDTSLVYAVRGGYDGIEPFKPSTDWAQGGPIIEREKITVVCAEGDYDPSKAGTSECYKTYWVATTGRLSASTVYGPQGDEGGDCFQIESDAIHGPTPLIAAMRCYVASKLGEEIDIPEKMVEMGE